MKWSVFGKRKNKGSYKRLACRGEGTQSGEKALPGPWIIQINWNFTM